MKIVFLDADTLGKDISLEPFKEFGEVVVYGNTAKEEVCERAKGADVLITNKVHINERTLGAEPSVRFVGVAATGVNIIDLDYTKAYGITVTNVKGYSTESVAQHTFSLLFYLLEKSYYYDDYVKSERYIDDTIFTHFSSTFHDLYGMIWGIVGLGEIGKRVAQIAKTFGCQVIYYSTSGKNTNSDYERVEFDDLLQRSDIISIHAPLNSNTRGLFDKNSFNKMKSNAILINVGRGPIIDEQALYDALISNKIAAAGLDVLAHEPMAKDCPLRSIKDSGRLFITPHIAWATLEARKRLLEEVHKNIRAYQNGEARNVIV